MMSLWDALRMNMMISYQELVRTFLRLTSVEVRIVESLVWHGFQAQKKPPLSDFDLHLMVPKAGLEPARISTVVRLSYKLL
ncbi:hypothetical protein QCN08_16175, partial [Enterobacter roggenkampii]|uniref:hypothetical protein n=1 Tax=Enterobacter roggenkampii TaxID=1812935 RepID=UPI002FD7E725